MKITGRESRHEEISEDPSIPFTKDLEKDLDIIDLHYGEKEALKIRIKMIAKISNHTR